MSVTPTLVSGDDSVLPVQLHKDELPFVINTGASIKASVVSKDRKTIILPPVDVVETTEGSSWINSLVVAKFTSEATNAIPATYLGQSALLEIQVDDGGKLTWFVTLKLLKGTIA